MGDTASLFSTTDTLVDWRDAHELLARNPSAEGSERLLNPSELYATILVSFHMFKLDVDSLTAAGFPAVLARDSKPIPSSMASSSSSRLSLAKKRYQIQIPRLALDDRQIKHLVNPTSWQEARQRAHDAGLRRGPGSSYTLLEFMLADLVNYRERPMLHQVLRLLFMGSDIKSPELFYPANLVKRAPKWATSSSASSSSDAARREVAAASAGIRWASLMILSAPLDGSGSNAVTKEREREYFENLKTNEAHKLQPSSDEAAQRRFEDHFVPSPAAEAMLTRILNTLERRGALWTAAGHDTSKTMRNEDPSKRPAFVVQGVFPETLLDKFKDYHRSNLAPMPSDLSEDAKSKRAPLLLEPISHPVSSAADDKHEQTSDVGVDAHSGDMSREDEDGLEGCAVRVVFEPFKTGSPWEVSGYGAVMMGAGFGGAGMG